MKKQKININIPTQIKWILQQLTKAGYEAYVVGGCVRDVLMQKQPNDWDITTNAKPNETQGLFLHTIDTGKEYGTVTVVYDGVFCEVTTFRGESDYQDHRHPNTVWFSDTIKEDLQRRDFTINAMACDLHGWLIDLFGGKNDIDQRILRCVGDAFERFNEDPLRMLRAVRFAVACGLDVEHRTEQAILEQSSLLQYVSTERCRDELIKMFQVDALDAIELLYHYKLLGHLFPGFRQFKENNYLEGVNHAKTVEENMAILLRNLVFDSQDKAIEVIFKERLRYLKFSEAKVVQIARAAASEYDNKYTSSIAVRRELARVGIDVFRLAARVWRLEDDTHNVLHTIDTIVSNGDCISIGKLAINGRDLMKLGFKPNQQLGETLHELLDIVLEDPKKNKKEQLLMLAKQMRK
jgi:tRNA nucleotidyltransferase (CCA-adding enzyme)